MARVGKFGTVDVTVLGDELKVGDKALDFVAGTQDLGEYNFYDEEEGKIKIISVVPSLDTDVCEIQTKMFQKATEFFSDEVSVVTVSNDLPFAQIRFCENKEVPSIKFVSDYNHRDFSKKYGTLIE